MEVLSHEIISGAFILGSKPWRTHKNQAWSAGKWPVQPARKAFHAAAQNQRPTDRKLSGWQSMGFRMKVLAGGEETAKAT